MPPSSRTFSFEDTGKSFIYVTTILSKCEILRTNEVTFIPNCKLGFGVRYKIIFI